MTVLPFLVGDTWTTGRGEPFESVNPADGSVAARLGAADAADVDAAVACARAAFAQASWRNLLPHRRGRLLSRMADLIERDIEPLARAQMADNGKTLRECRAQAADAASVFRYYAALCETAGGEITPQRGPSTTFTVYEPMGVVAAITPWNSPLTIEAQKLAPILAAGNAVVLKPSEVTPQVALRFAALALEAGFPPGIVNVVTGLGDVGRALVAHPGIDLVSFTGGTVAGRHIAEIAGRKLCPVVLELGGKSPNVVFADADLDAAVKGVAAGIFVSGGQSCIAGSRIFVEAAIYDTLVERLAVEALAWAPGKPEDPKARIGPMASFAHRDAVERAVDVARS
ncbi:MAG TPA: aldehyde dehydrogenase family protein, partial [Saliniramus sp.]|nr:aldehyde dehydrogenase family protein [Saliniramus sp.]